MRNKKKLVGILVGVLLVAALVFAGWKLFSTKKAPSPDESPQSSAASETTQSNDNDIPNSLSTKQYENGLLALKLDYPDTWKVTESENKDGVRIESPDFSYQTLDKGQVTGNFRIYVRKGARPDDSKYIGRGVAIGDSEKLVYTKPTLGQRAETTSAYLGSTIQITLRSS